MSTPLVGLEGADKASTEIFDASIGKKILRITLGKEEDRNDEGGNPLHIKFTDLTSIVIRDRAQICCESRWMSTDDDLEYYQGANLLGARVAPVPDADYDDYDDYVNEVHEQVFFIIKTTKGEFTMVNHNSHNGYYSGFDVCVSQSGEQV